MSRSLRRFFVDSCFAQEGAPIQLSIRETFHLTKVLRLKVGDSCEVFNRAGWGAQATIETLSENQGAQLRLGKIFPLKQKSLLLKVSQAIPQKKKMDTLVDWAAQLGVTKLWITETKRTVVNIKADAKERAKKRWERIVVEACKQSGSPVFTQIEGPLYLDKVIKKIEPLERAFIFHLDPEGISFSNWIEELKVFHEKEALKSVFLLFGPEGGFTEEEVKMARSRGVRTVYLGESTLRVEAAFMGVLSSLRFLFG